MLYFVMKPEVEYDVTHYRRWGRPLKSKKLAIATAEKLGKGAFVDDSTRKTIYVAGSAFNHHHN